jgi:hypothetical protein
MRKTRIYTAIWETISCVFALSATLAIFSNALTKSSLQSSDRLFTSKWQVQAGGIVSQSGSESSLISAYSIALRSTFILPAALSAFCFLRSAFTATTIYRLETRCDVEGSLFTDLGVPVYGLDNLPFADLAIRVYGSESSMELSTVRSVAASFRDTYVSIPGASKRAARQAGPLSHGVICLRQRTETALSG